MENLGKFRKITYIALILSSYIFADENKNLNINDITVIASKTDETINNIPQTITLITKEELEDKEIKTVSDVIKEIPNLTSRYLYFEAVNFRGINTSVFTNNNPVVIYIDGIPQSSQFGYNVSFANVERVEVLRGPQGTLYGKDSIGGVINIVTKTPTNEYEGEIGFEYGSNNYLQNKFNLSGPIVKDKLFFGINSILSKSDGDITNHNTSLNKNANRNKTQNFNGNLLYKPTDDLDIKFNISKDKNYRYWINGGVVSSIDDIHKYKRKDFKDTNYDVDTYTKIDSTSQALNLSYNINNLNLNSLTTHKKLEMDGNYDTDWGNSNTYKGLERFQDATTKTFTQEFRLSNKEDANRWLVGLYFEDEDFLSDRYGVQRPPNTEINAVSKTTSKTYATFGQITFPIIDKLDLTVGGRYQKIKKNIDLNLYMAPIGSKALPINKLNDENTWNTFLPKIALSYKINDDITSYINISKGYMPGGYNYSAQTSDRESNLFDAQTSINYELGLRGSFLDNKLNVSSSIFYMDIDDIHIYNFNPTTGGLNVSNGGKAHSQGIELEVKYDINNNWRIESSAGIIQAKYDEYANNNNNVNKKIENTPSHTINLGLSYYSPQGYYGRVDLQNQGSMYFNTANTIKESSYTTANLKVGYSFNNWNIYTYAKNLTDKSYISTVQSDTGGYLVTYGEGRFIGIGLKYSF
ncbi:TonB-dependent siderophore receptor [Arcobacter nitrofigilis DSM 7299]|uniref:TonB-dependent siderophore receptor n=1 Tax=Arcobacter nitrofigilis (strain ATCC 33309 / DSM 7299 / CCUG 15893 / LMG 7604 / NCTC 12251 / CI) TaxID=572480 RepID=D5V4L7_ARCNC|nr:TonB-dependent siderophore receptor [Arcobacter nitrofigilis]ADG92922.1 TonB-dependent siderophore receptor [Arcobacter nitrofigilis DSM 7299]